MKLCFAFLLLFISCIINAQQKVIPLYKGAAPGSENWNWEEKQFFVKVPLNANVAYNITKPSLTVFTPDSTNGTAIIICPGGGFRVLNIEHEGSVVAKELNKKGIIVFMLRYRLIHSLTDDPWAEMMEVWKDTARRAQENIEIIKPAMNDMKAAIAYVREHAAEYKIDAKKIGIIGFSAGANLSVLMANGYTPETRPDFAASIYGSRVPDKPILSDAPPLFIAIATDDQLASPSKSVQLYTDWLEAKKSVELHIYAKGGHGLRGSVASVKWITRFTEWLDTQGFLKPKQ